MLKEAITQVFVNEATSDAGWVDQMAQFIMDFFGYEDRILDNKLTPRDRDIFYMLEGVDLLKTEMEEATLQKGKIWRIHYWVLNREKIHNLNNIQVNDPGEVGKIEGTVYDNLSDQIWTRHE